MTPTSYADAAKILDAGKTVPLRESRKIANNTWLERRDARTIAVRLHRTDVVTFHAGGSVTFDTGGWETSTTRDRLNAYAPGGIRFMIQKRELRYVLGRDYDNAHDFHDGMRYHPQRGVLTRR